MKSLSKILILITSIFITLIAKVAKATAPKNWINSEDQNPELTDLMIKEKIFIFDASSKSVQIDEQKLLNNLKLNLIK